MTGIESALRLAEEAVGWAFLVPIFSWPLMLLFVGVMMGTSYSFTRRTPYAELWKRHYWLVFTHLLFFVFAIALGTGRPYREYPGVTHQKDELGLFLLNAIWYGSLISCAFWIWRMRGMRWPAACLMLAMEAVVGGSLLVAGMSITGDWI